MKLRNKGGNIGVFLLTGVLIIVIVVIIGFSPAVISMISTPEPMPTLMSLQGEEGLVRSDIAPTDEAVSGDSNRSVAAAPVEDTVTEEMTVLNNDSTGDESIVALAEDADGVVELPDESGDPMPEFLAGQPAVISTQILLSDTMLTKIDPEIADHFDEEGYVEVVVNLLDVETLAATPPEELPGLIASTRDKLLTQAGLSEDAVIETYTNVAAVAVNITETQLRTLAADNRVTYLLHNGATEAAILEIAESLELLDDLGSPTIPQTGQGQVIAVLDTGIDTGVPLLNNAVIGRECLVDDCEIGAHGTLMAGVMRSIAPSVQLLDVQVMDSDGIGVIADWLAGLDYVLELSKSQQIDVVNLSLATSILYAGQCDSVLSAPSFAIAQLRQNGISVFAASGNQGMDGFMSAPACLNSAVAVGGVYSDEMPVEDDTVDACPSDNPGALVVSCFTNKTVDLELLAPSTNVEIADITNTPTYGTSQATAIVSAVTALMLDANQYLSPTQILTQLKDTGTPVTIDTIMGPAEVPAINPLQAVGEAANTVFACSEVTTIPASECAALLTIYGELNGPAWSRKEGWGVDFDPCNWYGVNCTDGHVTNLWLNKNLMSGVVPSDIADLPYLIEFFVANNQLRGDLPEQMTTMTRLVSMDLGYNKFNIYGYSPELDAFLNQADVDWKQTQTYAPINVDALATSREVLYVFWSPIFFDEGEGRYEVECVTQPGGTTMSKPTDNKQTNHVRFTAADGVVADKDYYCRVRTISDSDNLYVPVTLTSDYGDEDVGSTTEEGIGEPLTRQPVKDTFISSSRPNTNSGGDRFMHVGTYNSQGTIFGDSHALMDFDIPSELPLAVDSATLTLKVFGVNVIPAPDTIALRSIDFDWPEALTYNTAPLPFSFNFTFKSGIVLPRCADILSCNTLPGEGDLPVTVTLNEGSIEELQKPGNHGIYIANTSDNSRPGATFCTRNTDPGEPCNNATDEDIPTLEISFKRVQPAFNPVPADASVGVESAPTLAWEALLDNNGNSMTFDIRWGDSESNLGNEMTDLQEPTFTLPEGYGDTVYWQIITKSAIEGSVEGEVWSFKRTFCTPGGFVDFSDCIALTNFFNATGGSEIWNETVPANQTWLDRPVCDWYGVTCAGDGRIIGLDLSDATVQPAGDDISDVLFLRDLEILNLSNSNLTGNMPDFSLLTKLRILNLSNNEFMGSPGNVAGLTQLQTINYSGNQLTGKIPASYGTLPALMTFNVRNNWFESDPFAVLANVTTLQHLDLRENLFRGALGGIGNLVNLQTLHLAYNAMGNYLPVELAALTQVSTLNMSGNAFELPDAGDVDAADLQALTTWLNTRQPTWADTQAIPPDSFDASGANNVIDLTWTQNSTLPGHYVYGCVVADNDDDVPPQYKSTGGMDETSVSVDRLFPNEKYDCEVMTVIPASASQKNHVVSRRIKDQHFVEFTGELGDDINNPLPIESIPYYAAVDPNIVYQPGEEVPTCVTDASGRRYQQINAGGEGGGDAIVVRARAKGLDGANPGISVIVQDEDGNLIYLRCETTLDETQVSAGEPLPQALQGSDVAFDMILEPGVDYIFAIINEDGAGGRIEFSLEEVSFTGCENAIGSSFDECEALFNFYYSVRGPEWFNNESWLINNNVCTWYGVSCEGGHVVGLSLPDNGLIGTITQGFGRLTFLQTLNLSYNQVQGLLPADFINLQALSTLDISYNQLFAVQPPLLEFMNNKQSGWQNTQTAAPAADSMVFTRTTPNSIRVDWIPILHTGGVGHYTLGYALTEAGPYTYIDVPGDKSTSSYEVTGLTENTPYFFVLQTTSTETYLYKERTVSSLWSAPRQSLPLFLNTKPDTDGDGFPDNRDECPWRGNEDGLGVDPTGCPYYDIDRDGILDRNDACPSRGNEDGLGIDATGCPFYDIDRDGVFDRNDDCPARGDEYGAGIDETGCPLNPPPEVTEEPDMDDDGMSDAVDACPREGDWGLGLDETGCPYKDTDGDGMFDRDDTCVSRGNEGGLGIDETGCPYMDTDRDGVFDRDDTCPARGNEANLGVDGEGCPYYDTDSDGVFDRDDSCLTEGDWGLGLDATGCPYKDTDSDTVHDRDDACPAQGNEGGLGIGADGCPYYDADGDAVFDRDDLCPTQADEYGNGVDADGCPIPDTDN